MIGVMGIRSIRLFIFALIVLLLASCAQTASSETGAIQAERETIQTAMDVIMADQLLRSVVASADSTNSWSNYPTGDGVVPLSPLYLRQANSKYFYCWISSGEITHQDDSPLACEPEAPLRRPEDGLERPSQDSKLVLTRQELIWTAVGGVGVIALLVLWLGLPRNYAPPVEDRGDPNSATTRTSGAAGRRGSRMPAGPVEWSFWRWWVLASLVGVAVALAASLAMGAGVGDASFDALNDLISNDAIVLGMFVAIFGALIGGSLGVMQWLILRRQFTRAGWWVLASIVGWAVGAAAGVNLIYFVFYTASNYPLTWAAFMAPVVIVAMTGAVVGVLQWLFLRRHVSQAVWWVLANVIGYIVAIGVGGALGEAANVAWGEAVGVAVFVAACGGVFGAITGIAQVRLLRQPVPAQLRIRPLRQLHLEGER